MVKIRKGTPEMASFSKVFKSAVNPVLDKVIKKTGMKKPTPVAGENTMGALLRFLLINAVSVIGAKLINEAAEYASEKFRERTSTGGGAQKIRPEQATQAAPALDTKYCAKCGAFMIKGEKCDCTAKS